MGFDVQQAEPELYYHDCVMDFCQAPDETTQCRTTEAFMDAVRKELQSKNLLEQVETSWREPTGCLESKMLK
jgi:hypothetical protein